MSIEYENKTMRGFFGAAERKQEILTPPSILDVVRAQWPEGISLDPCGHPDSIVGPDNAIMPPDDGLAHTWPDRTFVNPPYRYLGKWMDHAMAQSGRQIMLAPVRSNRAWWIRYAKSRHEILFLKPLAFVGYDQTFPAPLALFFSETVNTPAYGLGLALGEWGRIS